jgi:hypothetical protein
MHAATWRVGIAVVIALFAALLSGLPGQAQEPPAVSKELQQAAEAGNPAAQWLLGWICSEKNDHDQALKWYRKAADQGFQPAQQVLHVMYANGIGVQKDSREADNWLKKSLAPRQTSDLERAANRLLEDPALREYALTYYRRKAEGGDAFAQLVLGTFYMHGNGVAKDAKIGIEWLQKAASQGQVLAQCYLGTLFRSGADGVPRDPAKAVEWLRKASENGSVNAMKLLGTMYMQGDGVPEDMKEGFKWYSLAAEKYSDPMAQAVLGTFYEVGDVCPKDADRAMRLFRLSAEQGEAFGQWVLGLAYYKGELVPKDDKEAGKWLEKAAAQGNADAQALWGFFVLSGRAGKRDFAAALKLFVQSSEGGCEKSREFLAHLADGGFSISEDDKAAMAAFLKKAEDGDAEASWLAYFWATCATKRDAAREARLLRLAAQKGNAKARAEMERRGLK